MPRLDSQNVSLLLVDIQEKLFPKIANHVDLLHNSVRLLRAAQVFQAPVLVTEQYPKGIGATIPPLQELLPPETPIIEKTSFSCCGASGFSKTLEGLGRPVTVVFGIETHICVLSTVEDLRAEGRDVVLAADACGSRKKEHHDLALAAARMYGAFVLPTETVIYRMLGAAGTPEFKELLPLFK